MPLSPQLIERVRREYAEGRPIAPICRDAGIGRGTLYYWLSGGPDAGERHLAPIKRRRVKPRPPRGRRIDRASVVTRLWRTAERQVREIEARLEADTQEPAERERDARMLAILVKTLRELTQLDAAKAPEVAADDDDVPRDIDEFRRELARRMEAFVRERADGGVPGDAEPA